MRRIIVVTLGVALYATAVWAVHATALPAPPSAKAADAADVVEPPSAMAVDPHDLAAIRAANHQKLAGQLARARLATARYATNLGAAKAAGYQIITRDIPDMGWHYLNMKIQGFDVTKPHILVYQRHGRTWQLSALEWVFPAKPARPPLPGATYGSFAAACHYRDGTFVPAPSQDQCPTRSPQTGARFNFWHPDLVTLHVWIWYPNPTGLYDGTNPYVRPFNHT
jgi:hypothetical protein